MPSTAWRIMCVAVLLAALACLPSVPRARAIRAGAVMSGGAACAGAHLTMSLTAGRHLPDGGRAELPPAGLPAGPLLLQVPLYPRAQPDVQDQNPDGYSIPDTSTMKSTWAQFALAAGANDAVLWYRAAFAACGYSLNPLPQACCWLPTSTQTPVAYFSRHMDGVAVQVQLDFAPLPDGRTLALYIAVAYYPPARDLAAPLLTHVLRAAVTYYPPGHQVPQPPVLHFTITKPTALARLVASFDSVPVDQGIVSGCGGSYDWEWADIVFTRRAASPLPVQVHPDCGVIMIPGVPLLLDAGYRVWNTLTTLAPPTGYKPCDQELDPGKCIPPPHR